MNAESTAQESADRLLGRIENREARAAVVGLGYVGLPLAVEIARAGFSVVALDNSLDKIAALERGECYVPDVDAELLARLIEEKKIRPTADPKDLADCELFSICVPTPLRKTKDPDLSYVLEAADRLAQYLAPDSLVILESTTYPGATDEAVGPALEAHGRNVGRDLFLCFSPERVDPGNPKYQTANIPKVIGGADEASTRLGTAFYGEIFETVVPVSNTRAAEMVKLLENTFRMINIGLANEMAVMCEHMDIDVWEVIEAAATKPFGFLPLYPGPGLGGHCIPVDPHYLSWKTKQAGYSPRFIELAAEINGAMPRFVTAKIQGALNQVEKAVKGSHIHLVGVAYKRDVGDLRESPALDILLLLERLGARVTYSDRFAPSIFVEAGSPDAERRSLPLMETAEQADAVVIVTDHSGVDYAELVARSRLVVDARNATHGIDDPKIVRL